MGVEYGFAVMLDIPCFWETQLGTLYLQLPTVTVLGLSSESGIIVYHVSLDPVARLLRKH